jgi:hypothetical protein
MLDVLDQAHQTYLDEDGEGAVVSPFYKFCRKICELCGNPDANLQPISDEDSFFDRPYEISIQTLKVVQLAADHLHSVNNGPSYAPAYVVASTGRVHRNQRSAPTNDEMPEVMKKAILSERRWRVFLRETEVASAYATQFTEVDSPPGDFGDRQSSHALKQEPSGHWQDSQGPQQDYSDEGLVDPPSQDLGGMDLNNDDDPVQHGDHGEPRRVHPRVYDLIKTHRDARMNGHYMYRPFVEGAL